MAASRRSGFTLLELLVVLSLFAVLLGLLLPAVLRVRDAQARTVCTNNLRQIGLGLHNYHDARGVLPPGMNAWTGPQPFLAWSARLLPFIDQGPAWTETEAAFTRQRYFGGRTPHPGLSTVMRLYLCPSDSREVGAIPIIVSDPGVLKPAFAWGELRVAFTYYLGVSGSRPWANDGLFYRDSKVQLADILDGTSNTLMVGERPPSSIGWFGWWYAGTGQEFDGSADYLMSVAETNRTFRLPTCPKGPYRFGPGKPDDPCDTLHYWSRHLGGSHFLFADGSVRFLGYSAASILSALASRAGGEIVEIPD